MEAGGQSARHRAKVYQLNEDGQWDDKGTGYAACQFFPAHDSAFIVVVGEEDGNNLMESKVHMEDIYQRQGETIISWNDPTTEVDVALSFQDGAGCTELWEQICGLQGRDANLPDHDLELMHAQEEGSMLDEGAADVARADASVELLACEMRNLAGIAELMAEINVYRRPKLVEAIIKQDYIPQLVELFGQVEDLEIKEDLHQIYTIFRSLVMLNDAHIMEQLLRDDLIEGVIGALEHDPELEQHNTKHREYLREKVVFKEVVPIKDKAILAKIHQNFRLAYIKDVVLPRSLDDNTFAALNSIAFFNNVQIIGHLQNDEDFFKDVYEGLMHPDTEEGKLIDLFRLLLELCQIAKNLQLFNRSSFYRKFFERGLFEPIARGLMHSEKSIHLHCTEILCSSVNHDPSLLRQFVLSQRPKHELLHALVHVMVVEHGTGIKGQTMEIFRSLLDPDTMEGKEQDDFLNLFYEEFVERIMSPLTGPMTNGVIEGSAENGAMDTEAGDKDPESSFATRNHLCDLLCFCVQQHGYRIKYYILRNNVLNKVLRMCGVKGGPSKDKALTLASIRFFRTCMNLKDEFYNRYIIKNRSFDPVVSQLTMNGSRDNLINSSILELFEFVRRENVKSVIAHLAENYADTFKQIRHSDIFKGILLRNEQNQEYTQSSDTPNSAGGPGHPDAVPRGQRRGFPDEDEDAAYFNESDEDEDTAATSSTPQLEDKENCHKVLPEAGGPGRVGGPSLEGTSPLPLKSLGDHSEEATTAGTSRATEEDGASSTSPSSGKSKNNIFADELEMDGGSKRQRLDN